MGILAIATYRPLPGKETAFSALLEDHIPALRRAGFVTERPSITARAGDGAILEIFEWRDEAAKDGAHKSDAVMAVWSQFRGLCDIVSLSQLAETQRPFANFELVD